MIVCHVCGTENPDGTQFCNGCGVELSSQAAQGAPAEQASTSIVAPAGMAAAGSSVQEAAPAPVATEVPAPAATDMAAPSAPDAGAAPAGTQPGPVVYEPLEGDSALPGEAPGALDAGQQAAAPVPAPEGSVAPVQPAPAPAALETNDAAAAQPGGVTPAQSQPASAEATPAVEAAPAAAMAPSPAAAAVAPASVAAPFSAGNPRLLARQMGAFTGQALPLNGDRLVVGRFDPSTGPVDIDLSGQPGAEHVSRRHAELYRENGRWLVRDLGSTNGVYVRGATDAAFGPRIQAPYTLQEGDEIAFGNMKFVYREAPDGAQAGAPAGNA